MEDLTLLAHSMGGLVARSACHYAELSGQAWRVQLKNLVFLGTPHHGAPLERVGSLVDGLLGSNVVTRPFPKIGQVRSASIADLRFGYVMPADGQGADRFARAPDARTALPCRRAWPVMRWRVWVGLPMLQRKVEGSVAR